MSSFIPLRVTTHTRVSLPEKLAVHLTEQEDHICSLLDECTHWIKEHKGSTTSCRIAGGWVRDKVDYFISSPFPYSHHLAAW